MSDNPFEKEFGANADMAMKMLQQKLNKFVVEDLEKAFSELDAGVLLKLETHLDTIKNSSKDLGEVGETLKDSKVRAGLKQFGMNLAHMASSQILESLGLMSGFSAILEAIFSPLSLLSPLLQVIAAIIQEAMAPTMQEMAPYIQMAANYLIEAKDGITAFIQIGSPFINMIAILTGNVDQINNSFKRLGVDLNDIGKVFIVLNANMLVIQAGFEKLQIIFITFNTEMNKLKDNILDIPNKIGNLGKTIGNKIANWGEDVKDGLREVRDEMVDNIKGWGDKMTNAIKKTLGL